MDKRALYDGLDRLESEMEHSLEELGSMKAALHELVEKNAALEIENGQLRQRIMELSQPAQQSETKQGLSKSRMNLEKIYEDGFHVCNPFYGLRREGDEPCVFCLQVIYGESRDAK